MPRFDLDEDDLADYQSSATPPPDLAEFWNRTIAEARTAAWEPKVEPVRCGLRIVDVFDVTFSGFGGEPIKAWLHRPAGQAGDLPVVVRYCGYEGGRGLPHQVNPWPLAGYAKLQHRRPRARKRLGLVRGYARFRSLWPVHTRPSNPWHPRPGNILLPPSFYRRRTRR